jgi:ArsR family transcriptional regulator
MTETFTTTSAEELYKLYHREIVRFFAEHLADREAAWDLCHEVFVRLLLTLASGTDLQRPQHWLMRVAKNLLIDTYRRRQITAELPSPEKEGTMLTGDATLFRTLIEREEVLHLFVETFHTLPEKYQRLLFWREIERLPLQELALRTGANEAVLSTELWRARKMLQKKYLQRRFANLLPEDEEIFAHLDSLIQFRLTASPEEQLQDLALREKHYFERIAPTWDAYVASAYEMDLQERITRLLPWHDEMTVLDAGTGTGYLAGMLAPLAGKVVGIDSSPAMLAQARRKLDRRDPEHVLFREGMVEQLPLADDSVDVAVCHMLLHHVISPRTALAELKRVVRPGGYLLIVDACAHKHHWTPEAFGDMHYGTDITKLRRHLKALQVQTLLEDDAGLSHSGVSIGNDVSFSNFLLLGQVGKKSMSASHGQKGA